MGREGAPGGKNRMCRLMGNGYGFLGLKAPACPGKEFAFDLKTVGAIESFIRREGGPVRICNWKAPLSCSRVEAGGIGEGESNDKIITFGACNQP